GSRVSRLSWSEWSIAGGCPDDAKRQLPVDPSEPSPTKGNIYSDFSALGQLLPYLEAPNVLDGRYAPTTTRTISSPSFVVRFSGPNSLQLNSPRILVFETPADPAVGLADSNLGVKQLLAFDSVVVSRMNGSVTAAAMGGTSYNLVAGVSSNA